MAGDFLKDVWASSFSINDMFPPLMETHLKMTFARVFFVSNSKCYKLTKIETKQPWTATTHKQKISAKSEVEKSRSLWFWTVASWFCRSALSWKMGTMVGAAILFLNTQHQANVITNLRVARPDLIKVVHVVKAFLSAGMACPAQCARSPPWHFDMRRAQRLYCSFHKKNHFIFRFNLLTWTWCKRFVHLLQLKRICIPFLWGACVLFPLW